MKDFNEWLKKSEERKREKEEISDFILLQMNKYFQPERLSEKTSKEDAIV